MHIDIDVSMEYEIGEGDMICLTVEAARTDGQFIHYDWLEIDNANLHFIAGEAGVGRRCWTKVWGTKLTAHYRAWVEVTRPVIDLCSLPGTPMPHLPAEALTFLRPSRFCQSDMFPSFTKRRFAHLDGGAKIAAIRDWVASEMTYVPASSNADTSVVDTFTAREGVCRDYAHMVCALARASGIPARYASVYAPWVQPPDFHAIAQVWLDGHWHNVDATYMSAPENTVVIAVGRDACDVAFMESVEPATLVSQNVSVKFR